MLVFYRILAYIVYKKYVLELTPVQITRHADKNNIFQVCFGLLNMDCYFLQTAQMDNLYSCAPVYSSYYVVNPMNRDDTAIRPSSRHVIPGFD